MLINEKKNLLDGIKSLTKEINSISNTYLHFDGINVSQREILNFLYQHGSLTVPQIGKHYKASRQHIQINVNVLLEKALVIQEDNSQHKRSKLIALTSSGRKLYEEIIQFEENLTSELFSQLSKNEIALLDKSLNTLLNKAKIITDELK